MNLFEGLGQWSEFFAMVVCGALCGLLYLLLQVLRSPLPEKPWIVIPCDLLFCGISLALFVVFCYRACYLSLRWHIFLGFALGFTVIWIILHSAVAKFAGLVYNRIRKSVAVRRERRLAAQKSAENQEENGEIL
jgi:hypothetical protein